jgi:hypothetical protein
VWSRNTYEEQIREVMDARTSSRWKKVDLMRALGLLHYLEWGRLLEKNDTLRSAIRTNIARDAEGTFLLSALNSGAGDALEAAYKPLEIRQGGACIPEENARQMDRWPGATASSSVGPRYGWFFDGDRVVVEPRNTTAVDVRIQHRPQRADLVTTDTDDVVWPEGHELVLVLMTAAQALLKGGGEADLGTRLRGEAGEYRRLMYQELVRRGARPVEREYGDDPGIWSPNGGW